MKKILTIVLLVVLAITLAGCTQADKVNSNLRREAEDFKVRRRITVFNTRTDRALMQITGLLAIDVDSDGERREARE